GVFARKPAPVQYTWLGYLSTTGLDAIDYRLCDAHTDPPGIAEAWQVETPARMPDSQWCYAPPFEVPQPGPLPRLRNGYWTFGSANQVAKLNRHCLALWSRVLRGVEGSRLRVLGADDACVRERLLGDFSQLGIDASRIDLVGRLPLHDYFASYRT